MARITLPSTDFEIEIPDFQIGESVFKRKIKVISLEYNIENKTVRTDGIIDFYNKNKDGTYGDKVGADESIVARSLPIHMLADNSQIVNAATGEKVCTEDEVGNDEDASSPVHGLKYMGQFDFFFAMASSHAIIINSMITNYFLSAVAVGRFN